MLFKSRSILLAATLMAAPLATAMAQQNNPTGNLGSNRSATAAPGTADSSAASTMHTGDNAARGTSTNSHGGTSMNNTTPGATGHTVVPGSTSSQAGAAGSTVREKTGGTSAGGGTGSR
jgi:hypothetical protein